jgi:hypothetical protein
MIRLISSALIILCILLNVVIAVAQPLPDLQTRIFKESNALRKDPAGYYKKYKKLFDAKKNASVFFQFVKPETPLIWSDSLYNEAKNAMLSNYKFDSKYTKSFCGSAGFGANHKLEDSTVINFVIENYTTLLSTDFQAIGIYAKKEKYSSANDTYYIYSYAFIATKCGVPIRRYSFPGTMCKIDSSKVNFKMLNTGVNCTYMSADEKEMLKEINFARCYPEIYSKIIANSLINEDDRLSFNEYIAGQEIVEQLSKMKPLNKLLPDERLYKSAKTHGQDCAKSGRLAHTGSDNSSPFDRIKKVLGSDYIQGQENLMGGSNPRDCVINVLIDGGIGSRGHRENIIDPRWTHAGCYHAGKVGDYSNCYVQNFAKIK